MAKILTVSSRKFIRKKHLFIKFCQKNKFKNPRKLGKRHKNSGIQIYIPIIVRDPILGNLDYRKLKVMEKLKIMGE